MRLVNRIVTLVLFLSVSLCVRPATATVDVNLDRRVQRMNPIWAWFGYDEPNYTYMKDGRKLLAELSALGNAPVYIRMHNLMTTGDGEAALKWGSTNMYTETADGQPVYQWNIVDSIFDTLVGLKLKPLVEIGFMPQAISSHPNPYRHHWKPGDPYGDIFTGWAYPPADYEKWREIVYRWALHCRERYGDEEVSTWLWEVWNEPNLYLQGSFEEYCKMYDYAADGLKRAIPSARIGGPHTTDPTNGHARRYLERFMQHCADGINYATGEVGSPLDYVGFHAKGFPRIDNDTVVMDIRQQLINAEAGFRAVSESEKFSNLPVIIGEFDPEGCAACSVDFNPQNDYRNGTLYASTVAATYSRLYQLAAKYKVNLAGAVTWAFEFEDQKWFAGFRDLSTNGVDKPVLNVFRMFGKMGGDLVEASSTGMEPLERILDRSVREQPEIGVLASKGRDGSAVMIWNYHDKNRIGEIPDTAVITVRGLNRGSVTVTQYRIDQTSSNAFTRWRAMGSPQNPTPDQITLLEKAGGLEMYSEPEVMDVAGNSLTFTVPIERQAVILYRFTDNVAQPAFVPNDPVGTPQGIIPGRVTLARDPDVAKWDGMTGRWWDEGNIDQEILDRLYSRSLCELTGEKSVKKAWDSIFRYHNQKVSGKKQGYRKGELIAVKINLNNTFETDDADNEIDQSAQGLRSLLRSLIDQGGVRQRDILVYDATESWRARNIPDRIYQPLHKEFPGVRWMSCNGSEGVEAADWQEGAITYTSPDVQLGTYLPRAVVEARYMINCGLLKGHELTGLTICAKNHFGTIRFPARQHNSSTVHQMKGQPGDYSALVDLMGSPNLGKKTILYIAEGLYGMQTNVGQPRADRDSWDDMFGGGWSACMLMSQDVVALESVCLDLLYGEFGGELGFSGAPAFPKGACLNSDNYLREAAMGTNARFGQYRPNGVATGSLGIFEHWNPSTRTYTAIDLHMVE